MFNSPSQQAALLAAYAICDDKRNSPVHIVILDYLQLQERPFLAIRSTIGRSDSRTRHILSDMLSFNLITSTRGADGHLYRISAPGVDLLREYYDRRDQILARLSIAKS